MSTVSISVRSIGCKPVDVDVSPDVQVNFIYTNFIIFIAERHSSGFWVPCKSRAHRSHDRSHADQACVNQGLIYPQVAELRALIGQKLAFPPDRLKLVREGHPLLDTAGRASLQHGGALS